VPQEYPLQPHDSNSILLANYDYRLVALSVIIAILAAYAALDLVGRVTAARGSARFAWLSGGAGAMGMGIWAMHYVGMLAYSLPVSVSYDWPTVLASFLAAVLAAAVALYITSREELGALAIAIGGAVMGTAVATMHYIGMEAMRLPAMCHYSKPIVGVSVLLAVVISVVALWLSFHLRTEQRSFGWRKIGSAALMGAAIPVMHYTGMAAVTYTPMRSASDVTHSVQITALGTLGVVAVSLTVLLLAIGTSFVDRRFSAQAIELQLSEQRLRQLVESAQVVLWRSAVDLQMFTYVNQEAGGLLGYPSALWTATRSFWLDHIHPEDHEYVVSCCKLAMETGAPQRFEHRMIGTDGGVVWLKTSVRLVEDDDRRELVGVMTDITDRKRAEQDAHAASRAKGELLAEINRLNGKLAEENSRMSAELEITHRLQRMMLPGDEELRRIPDLDIAGGMETASEVGGDYYDVFPEKDSVVFGIGDVTGHGLESGVIAIMLQTAVRTLLASGETDIRRFFDVLNRVVYDNARRMKCDRNLTFSLLRYEDRQVKISGQHEEVVIVRGNGTLERHDTINLGFPLGLEEKISGFVHESSVALHPGDVMVVYTDGLTDAVNTAGAAFGIERLCEVIKGSHRLIASRIRETILNSVREHIGTQGLFDDISLLVIKHA
jgi:PAS domain S-box-containing protein